MTVRLPETVTSLSGTIMVTTSRGDRLGSVSFLIQADASAVSDAEVAVTKE
jgi:hypothetical protein